MLGEIARPEPLRYGGCAQAGGGHGRDQLPVERLQVQRGIVDSLGYYDLLIKHARAAWYRLEPSTITNTTSLTATSSTSCLQASYL